MPFSLGYSSWWVERDLNSRNLSMTDLQSACFNHLHIYPYSDCVIVAVVYSLTPQSKHEGLTETLGIFIKKGLS